MSDEKRFIGVDLGVAKDRSACVEVTQSKDGSITIENMAVDFEVSIEELAKHGKAGELIAQVTAHEAQQLNASMDQLARLSILPGASSKAASMVENVLAQQAQGLQVSMRTVHDSIAAFGPAVAKASQQMADALSLTGEGALATARSLSKLMQDAKQGDGMMPPEYHHVIVAGRSRTTYGCKSMCCEQCNGDGFHFEKCVDLFCKTCDGMGRVVARALSQGESEPQRQSAKSIATQQRAARPNVFGVPLTDCPTCVLVNAADNLCTHCDGAGYIRRPGPVRHKANLLKDARTRTYVTQPETIELLQLAGVPLRIEEEALRDVRYIPVNGLPSGGGHPAVKLHHYGPGLLIRVATLLRNAQAQEQKQVRGRFNRFKTKKKSGKKLGAKGKPRQPPQSVLQQMSQVGRDGGTRFGGGHGSGFGVWDPASTVTPWTTMEMADLLRELWESVDWRRWFNASRSFVSTNRTRLQAWIEECEQWRTERRALTAACLALHDQGQCCCSTHNHGITCPVHDRSDEQAWTAEHEAARLARDGR